MPRSPLSTQRERAAGFKSSALMPLAETMRPRSIGTRSSVAPGACARTKPSKRFASAEGMSTRKNDGAFFGRPRVNSRCRLPSISMTVVSKASPSPSESMTVGVSAPGRCVLAMASRKVVERARGRRRAAVMARSATMRSSTRMAAADATKIAAMRWSDVVRIESAAKAATLSAVAAM
jgi:hypothetical protein